jgi:hypothetical protein
VANVYYEIADCVIPEFGGRYFVSHGVENAYVPRWRAEYLQHSERAWMEQEGRVWFVKHRYITSPTVDMKEFMWVKLKAETVHG